MKQFLKKTALRIPENERGMTLIELIVVLGILAGLATLAVAGLDGLGSRQRVDTSLRIMDQIKLAVAGDGVRAGRFVSDMGRLPVLHGAVPANRVEGAGLQELWDDCAALDTNGPATGYAEVMPDISFSGVDTWEQSKFFTPAVFGRLPGGWNGPYLDVGGEKLFDGYGNNIRYRKGTAWHEITDAALLDQGEIFRVASFGADNTEDSGGESWEETDIDRQFGDAPYSASLIVSIRVRDHNNPYPWRQPDNGTIQSWTSGASYPDGTIVRENQGSTPDDVFICDNETNSCAASSAPGADPEWRQLIKGCEIMNRMRVALFVPYADTDPNAGMPVRVREILNRNDGGTTNYVDNYGPPVSTVTSTWADMNSVTLENLPPGLRALYVYGYMTDGTNTANAFSSGLQMIELHPGVNHVTVYLSEPLL